MIFKLKIDRIKYTFKISYFLNKINKNYKKRIYNSLISSILRIVFRSKFIFQNYYFLKKNTDIKSLNEFWIIQIGFLRQKVYIPFIKLDFYLSNNPFCCVDLKNLPFHSKTCQSIYIKHFFKYFRSYGFDRLIKSWNNKLIPGGILNIELNSKNQTNKLEKLLRVLNKNNLYIKDIKKFELTINKTILITAIKQKSITSFPKNIPAKKIDNILQIIIENKDLFSNIDKICIIGYDLNKINEFLKNLNISGEIQSFESIELLSAIPDDSFNGAIIANYFEYLNYPANQDTFNALKRVLKPKNKILMIIPEKKNYSMRESAQFFDKGIIIRILDENNINFEWINLSSSFKMIQLLLKNENSFPIVKNDVKIFLLGIYSLRYTFLNNARWDSQARAFEKLGYETYLFDIEDFSFNYVFNQIKKHKPKILWIGGKIGYDFLKRYAEFFRNSEIKIVYWLWDIISPIKFDFNGIIDCMFITSKGEIPLYQKTYNLDRVYYMPVSIMPEIIHRNKFIKEEYDVGFSGQLNYSKLYRERLEYFKYIKKHYKTIIFRNIYNNLPEFYAKCKIIFGGTPYLRDLELYASNRPFVAFSCGCCFITNYFKGLERLAENEKHILWFHNNNELKYLLEKYLSNDILREEIKINAEKLAKEKHNYITRIQNMLDIVNGKADDFYGFID